MGRDGQRWGGRQTGDADIHTHIHTHGYTHARACACALITLHSHPVLGLLRLHQWQHHAPGTRARRGQQLLPRPPPLLWHPGLSRSLLRVFGQLMHVNSQPAATHPCTHPRMHAQETKPHTPRPHCRVRFRFRGLVCARRCLQRHWARFASSTCKRPSGCSSSPLSCGGPRSSS